MAVTSFQTTPGTNDSLRLTAGRPTLRPSASTQEISAPGAEILDVMIEVDDRIVVPLLPPALHVTLPPMATMTFYICRESNIGPFSLAQVRISCRLGARPRGLSLGSYVTASPEVAERLRNEFGFDARPGKVVVHKFHHRFDGSVEVDGREVLRVSGKEPVPVSSRDLSDMPTFNPVLLSANGSQLPRMVQVDSEVHTKDGTRARPTLETFEASAWNNCAIRQEFPVRALYYRTELKIHMPSYVVDPAGPTDQRSSRIDAFLGA